MLVNKIKLIIEQKLKETKRSVNVAEKMAGLPSGTIRNILTGKSLNPKIETLQAIANFFDCSIDELIGKQECNSSVKPQSDFAWNPKLFNSILSCLIIKLEQKKYKQSFNQVAFLLQQSYAFFFTKKEQKIDEEFIDWLIDSNLEVKTENDET